MSKKRTSAESNNDEQTNEGSEYPYQNEDNAKRAKLDLGLLNDTTLQYLPTELLECILVKAVAMEVKDLKLAKSVWKEKAGPVIGRLRTVCSHWNNILTILTTNFFTREVHRTLDRTAQETIRLNILEKTSIESKFVAITALKDEVFVLCARFILEYTIKVFDHNNWHSAKQIIPLTGLEPVCISACNVSNCVYIVVRNRHYNSLDLHRVSRDGVSQFYISPFMIDHLLPIDMISLSTNGNLIFLSVHERRDPDIISIYNADGNLLHEILLPQQIPVFRYLSAMQKPNENVVLGYADPHTCRAHLMEIDTSGSVVRQYQSSSGAGSYVNFADSHGRIMITDTRRGIELLDSEFNQLGFYYPQNLLESSLYYFGIHFDNERNAVMNLYRDTKATTPHKNVLVQMCFS